MAYAKAKKEYILVAAIDFGTTFSGWAYQFKHDYDKDPTKSFVSKEWTDGTTSYSKTPTTALINPDGKTLHSFGFEAESKFAELSNEGEQRHWFYCSLFKMELYQAKDIGARMMLHAHNGQQLPALLVFSLVIEYLKKDLMDSVNKRVLNGVYDQDVLWVLTVPAIWSDRAKQFMRQAAIKAGIDGNNLMIALEAEAASLYCKQLPLDPYSWTKGTTVDAFSPGQKYLVIDAGGGTIDINVHEVLPDDNLRALHEPIGSNCGGTIVDRKFEECLCQMFGQSVITTFREHNLDDYLYLLRQFEVSKREVGKMKEKSMYFNLPVTLIEICSDTGNDVRTIISQSQFAAKVSLVRGSKMKIESSLIREFYKESIESIVSQTETVLKDQRVSGCNAILMVGGYSEANILINEMKEKFSGMNVIVPSEPSSAVLKGAVIFGRNPRAITFRVCKYTYGVRVSVPFQRFIHPRSKRFVDDNGIAMAGDVFDTIVEVGQDVSPGHSYKGDFLRKPPGDITKGYVELFASTQVNPQLTDESGCFLVGEFPYDHRDKNGDISDIMPVLKFGDTEVEVAIVYYTTGKKKKTTLSLPD